jgi:predicted ester cyclase
MPDEDNIGLVRRYLEEVWHKRNRQAVDEFLAPGYRRHLSPIQASLDLAGQKQRLASFQAAFPDAALTLDDIFASGDQVVFRSTLRGTHHAALLGIAATGRVVTVGLIDIVRVEDNKIIEHWGGPDMLDLLGQLGAVISPA